MMKLWGCDVIAMVLCNVHVGMLNSFLFFFSFHVFTCSPNSFAQLDFSFQGL